MISDFCIEKVEKGLYYLISINGELSVKNIRAIRDAIEEAITIGHIYLVVNLEKTSYIDSSGIGLLMNVFKKLSASGGMLYLVAISEDVHSTLSSARILQVVPNFKTLDDAEREIG